MSELKRCPFCGGEATFWRLSEKTGNEYTDCVFVRCKDCYASTKKVEYNASIHKNDSEYNEVARLWNTRKPMERIMERLNKKVNFVDGKITQKIHWGRQFESDQQFMNGVMYAIEIVKEEGGIRNE